MNVRGEERIGVIAGGDLWMCTMRCASRMRLIVCRVTDGKQLYFRL